MMLRMTVARNSVMSTTNQVIHRDAPRSGVVTFSWVALKILLVVLVAIQLVSDVLPMPVYLKMITEGALHDYCKLVILCVK